MPPSSMGCANDVRAEPYAPWIEFHSDGGHFRVTLDEVVPAPPARGDNAWTLFVRDADGRLIEPERARMKAWMPDHGHGTNPLWVDLETTGGTRQRVGPFDLFMMGLWEFTFEITHAGNTDEARVAFCIETESTGVPRDGGVAAQRDSGVEPPECSVTAPTACSDSELDYARVQPIIESRCVTCHDGTQGQWPLTTYDHVADWYDDIRARMLDCNMPPWDSGVEMEAWERELILHWIRCGFPP